MLRQLMSVAVLAAALSGQVGPALAQWHGPPGPEGHHHGGPGRHGPWLPLDVILVYPAVVPPPPGPQVVYVQPQPIQAVPASAPYTDGQGRYCREYQSTVMVNGVQQSSYGTACLMPDGQWRIVQ